MATVNTLSTELTNIDAGTIDLGSSRNMGSRMRIKSASVAIAAADNDGSVYRFFRVHSSHSIKSLQVYTSGVLAGTDYDLGLKHTAANGSGTIAANITDLYADGLNVATAVPSVPHVLATTPYLEGRFSDAVTQVAKVNNQVWNDIGTATYASDPQLEFDVALTANTVGTAAGTIALVMLYTAGD